MKFIQIVLLSLFSISGFSQNFSFNFISNGKRVCLVESSVDTLVPSVTIHLLDASANTGVPVFISRRPLNGNSWSIVASNLAPNTSSWVDTNVSIGNCWEYQIKRKNTWTYNSTNYDATGYTVGSVLADNSTYQGQLILLVARNILDSIPLKYKRLKKELTAEGWFVKELIVDRASSWDSGDTVVLIKNQINAIYNSAPSNDKPKCLFILGHVPMPRSGSTSVTAPDMHDQNKGARGCDGYYADIDGIFTDTATYNPGGLSSNFAINMPGDFKWDQDFFPSDLELAFGRVDFADITDFTLSEIQITERYLDRLSKYKNVSTGFFMGDKSAFYLGFENSNDGSYRSLPSISKAANLFENTVGGVHPQWVQTNGPFKVYMQNRNVPEITEWNTYGMNATVFSSDQSYWGFGDVPQNNYIYSRIRALLAAESKCLVTLWTTTGVNIFHQAGTGQAFGLAIKEIMNHNATNQKIEKAPQMYDTEDWWNRTHFAYHGDPTIHLFQVYPPSQLSIIEQNGSAVLKWNAAADSEILGYHIYESESEYGKFTRITSVLVSDTNFTLLNHQTGNWYMVKAVKVKESGCGMFIQPSIGISVESNIVLKVDESIPAISSKITPNPSTRMFTIESNEQIKQISLYSGTGNLLYVFQNIEKTSCSIDLSHYPKGIFMLKIGYINGQSEIKKIIHL
jgi:hypothetical protein